MDLKVFNEGPEQSLKLVSTNCQLCTSAKSKVRVIEGRAVGATFYL
jgi:hypothetical protein